MKVNSCLIVRRWGTNMKIGNLSEYTNPVLLEQYVIDLSAKLQEQEYMNVGYYLKGLPNDTLLTLYGAYNAFETSTNYDPVHILKLVANKSAYSIMKLMCLLSYAEGDIEFDMQEFIKRMKVMKNLVNVEMTQRTGSKEYKVSYSNFSLSDPYRVVASRFRHDT